MYVIQKTVGRDLSPYVSVRTGLTTTDTELNYSVLINAVNLSCQPSKIHLLQENGRCILSKYLDFCI